MPTKVTVTVNGEAKDAQLRAGTNNYVVSVPFGTNISNLTIDITLPSNMKIDPETPVTFDFTKGKFTFKVTAGGKTEEYTIEVKVGSPAAPTEQAIIDALPDGCEIVYTINADGTISVRLLLPFVDGFDPSTIEAIQATLSGFDVIGSISFAYVDANGNTTPIEARRGGWQSALAAPPYLQISFAARSVDDVKKGALTKLEYWIKGNARDHTQTLTPGLAFNAITMTDATPSEPPSGPEPYEPGGPEPTLPGSGGGGGCNGGVGALGLLALAGLTLFRSEGKGTALKTHKSSMKQKLTGS
jgi:hypothetical protein